MNNQYPEVTFPVYQPLEGEVVLDEYIGGWLPDYISYNLKIEDKNSRSGYDIRSFVFSPSEINEVLDYVKTFGKPPKVRGAGRNWWGRPSSELFYGRKQNGELLTKEEYWGRIADIANRGKRIDEEPI